jgi:mono/diheme cytochrome c family protein
MEYRMKRFLKRLLVAAILVAAALGQKIVTVNVPVTAVTGVSWLTHLHRTFDETSMGKTGRLGPAVPIQQEQDQSSSTRWSDASPTITLHGVDLYRLNCRGCHGESGLGAPPEIYSVISPVRASSTVAIMARMKTAGMDITRSDAAKLAQQSKAVLLQRLHNGGQDMPSFPHLNDPEVRSLVAYLKQLASVPGAENEQLAVTESRVHVGEHIVKSTCHICHSATGENPTPQQLSDGAIPPLSTLTTRTNRAQFIRKVTKGAPVVMGMLALVCRGRMPVFYYLSEDEAADAYLYLTLAPPGNHADPSIPSVAEDRPGPAVSNTQSIIPASLAADPEPAKTSQPPQAAEMENAAFLPVAGLLVTLLIATCFAVTVLEMKRLASEGKGPRTAISIPVHIQSIEVADAIGGQTQPDLVA